MILNQVIKKGFLNPLNYCSLNDLCDLTLPLEKVRFETVSHKNNPSSRIIITAKKMT
jgi:hypothetical protein